MKYSIIAKISNHLKIKLKEKKLKKMYREIVEGKWEEKEKYLEEIEYIRGKGELQVFPYKFSDKYKRQMELVGKDQDGVFIKLDDNKKLYFSYKRDDACVEKFVAHKYRNLCREQDPHSAHRYYVDGFYPTSEDVFIDIGCAEGKEALLVADTVKKIYLFEANRNWESALNKSFSNYMEKTQIFSCFVGKRDEEEKMRSLDSCFGADCTGEQYFIKMDVEGAEKDVLLGGEKFIRNNKVKILCTTYHRQEDATELKAMLEEWGFKCSFSEGYMLWYHDPNGLKPPYFRKGVIRATNY